MQTMIIINKKTYLKLCNWFINCYIISYLKLFNHFKKIEKKKKMTSAWNNSIRVDMP